MLKVILTLFVLAVYVVTYALCKTASEADRQAEEMFARHMKELENK